MSGRRPKYCDYCGEPVVKLSLVAPKVVELCGKIWHRKCFKCSICDTSLNPKTCKFHFDKATCIRCASTACWLEPNANVKRVRDGIDETVPPGEEQYDYFNYLRLVQTDCSDEDPSYATIYEEEGSMTENNAWKEVLLQHRDAIMKSADPHDVLLNHLLDHLLSKRCIQDDHVQLVKSEPLQRARFRKLLDFVSSEGFHTFDEFCKAFENFGTEDKKQLAGILRQSMNDGAPEVYKFPIELEEPAETRKLHVTRSTPDVHPAMNKLEDWSVPSILPQQQSTEPEDYTMYTCKDDYDLHNPTTIYTNDLRTFIRVPLNEGLVRWKFMRIELDDSETDEGATQGSLQHIKLGYSIDPRDFPSLEEGFTLLHNAVIHCLPHEHVFTNPVLLAIALPIQFLSPSGVNRMSIFYSPTNIDEVPHWRTLEKKIADQSGNIQYAETAICERRSNGAVTSIENAEVILTLYHFCIFAVVINGRLEENQKTLARAFMKLRVYSNAYNVDIVILAGCDEKAMIAEERFALESGFRKVQSEQFHMVNIGGDLTVQLSRDDVRWMEDSALIGTQSYLHHRIDVWAGITKSSFCVMSVEAVTSGVDSSFTFSADILQTGRRPVNVKKSMDLHELVSMGSALHHCQCSKCTNCPTVASEYLSAESPRFDLNPLYAIPVRVARASTTARGEYVNVDLSQSPPPLPPRQPREHTRVQVDSLHMSSSSLRRVRGSMKTYSTIGKK